MSEGGEFELDYSIPLELRGFERLYPLLQGLTSGRSEQSFFERLKIILLLARWQEEPPSIRDIGRQLDNPLEGLSSHLQRLRTAHWLTDHEQYYQLTVHARILAFVLQLVSQPWQEHDSVAVVTQLYAAASSQELGPGPALLFQDVVSTIEESIRRLGQALVAEQTLPVSQYLSRLQDMQVNADQLIIIENQTAFEILMGRPSYRRACTLYLFGARFSSNAERTLVGLWLHAKSNCPWFIWTDCDISGVYIQEYWHNWAMQAQLPPPQPYRWTKSDLQVWRSLEIPLTENDRVRLERTGHPLALRLCECGYTVEQEAILSLEERGDLERKRNT